MKRGRNNCFRGGKIHVLATQCRTCIFHRGNLMHLFAGQVEAMVAEAKRRQSLIVCHSTLGTRRNAVCRGFYNRHSTLPLVLAEAMGIIEEQAECKT